MATKAHESFLSFAGDDLQPPSLGDFSRARRLDILLRDRRARFLPAGTTELNAAFENLFYAQFRNETATGSFDRIRAFHNGRSKAQSAEMRMRQGDRAVERVTHDYAAYATQARRDRGWLAFASREATQTRASGARFDSAAEYFAGSPAFQGAGQLTRYVDSREAVEHPDGIAAEYAFQAKFEPGPDGKPALRDPYTAAQLSRDMAEHQYLVLSGLSMADLERELDAAQTNEAHRQQYWADQLRGALRDEVAQPIARAALLQLAAR